MRRERGDTIVEVLIVLAVLSLAFGISYATANRGLQGSRNSEEHSEALGILNSQVQMLRSKATSSTQVIPNPSDPSQTGSYKDFCFDSGGGITKADLNLSSSAPPLSQQSPNSSCQFGSNGLYHVAIQCFPISGASSCDTPEDVAYYTATILWEGIGSLGQQQEQLKYQAYPGTGQIAENVTTYKPEIIAQVFRVDSCNSMAHPSLLTGPGETSTFTISTSPAFSATTTSGSFAFTGGLQPFTNYTVSLGGIPGDDLCPAQPSPPGVACSAVSPTVSTCETDSGSSSASPPKANFYVVDPVVWHSDGVVGNSYPYNISGGCEWVFGPGTYSAEPYAGSACGSPGLGDAYWYYTASNLPSANYTLRVHYFNYSSSPVAGYQYHLSVLDGSSNGPLIKDVYASPNSEGASLPTSVDIQLGQMSGNKTLVIKWDNDECYQCWAGGKWEDSNLAIYSLELIR